MSHHHSSTDTKNQTQEEFDWERNLERLRQQRQQSAKQNKHQHQNVSLNQTALTKTTELQSSNRQLELDSVMRQKVLQEYLQQWQHEHNAKIAADTLIGEADHTVLLQEDWLNAQDALHIAEDKQIENTKTIWFNRKKQSTAVKQDDTDELAVSPEQHEEADEHDHEADLFTASEQIPVTVQVVNPQVNPNLPVMCLSEQELLQRLNKRLKAHLTDAVAGMVRVAIQKQTATLSYQLQQSLNEQTPALVDEIIDYNLRMVMKEIRYDLRLKRR